MFKGIQKFRYTGQNTTCFKEYKYLGILDKTLHFKGYKNLVVLGKEQHVLRNTRAWVYWAKHYIF